MSLHAHDTSNLWLQAHSSEKKASILGAETYLRAGSAATSDARMASQSTWPSIGLWEEEDDAERGKRLCMGLGSPTMVERGPALSTTPAGCTNSDSSPPYEPSSDSSVLNLFLDSQSQARSNRLSVYAWASAPADSFESSGTPDFFESHQSALWSPPDKTKHSSVVQDAVQPFRFSADTGPGFGAPTSVADQLRTPWQSALSAEDLEGQYHTSEVGAASPSFTYDHSASQDEIDGVIASDDYFEAAGSVQTSEDRLCLGMVGNGHGFSKTHAEIG